MMLIYLVGVHQVRVEQVLFANEKLCEKARSKFSSGLSPYPGLYSATVCVQVKP